MATRDNNSNHNNTNHDERKQGNNQNMKFDISAATTKNNNRDDHSATTSSSQEQQQHPTKIIMIPKMKTLNSNKGQNTASEVASHSTGGSSSNSSKRRRNKFRTKLVQKLGFNSTHTNTNTNSSSNNSSHHGSSSAGGGGVQQEQVRRGSASSVVSALSVETDSLSGTSSHDRSDNRKRANNTKKHAPPSTVHQHQQQQQGFYAENNLRITDAYGDSRVSIQNYCFSDGATTKDDAPGIARGMAARRKRRKQRIQRLMKHGVKKNDDDNNNKNDDDNNYSLDNAYDDDSTFHDENDDDDQSYSTTGSHSTNSTNNMFCSNLTDKLKHSKLAGRRFHAFTHEDMEDMTNDMNLDFALVLNEELGRGMSLIEAHLCASNHLLKEFLVLKNYFRRAFLPATTQEVVFKVLESFLYSRLSALYMLDLDALTPKEASYLVCWMDDFLSLLSVQAPNVNALPIWEEDSNLLVSQCYLDKATRATMRQHLHNALELNRQGGDIREDANQHMVSGFPEQVAYLFAQQIAVAEARLPTWYMEHVVAVCNEELAFSICDMQLRIGSDWKDISVKHFCAIINDAIRLAQQSQERNEEYLHQEHLQQKGKALIQDLAELALHATNYLCQRILLQVCAPKHNLLTSVGDKEWEMGSKAIERSIYTFKDYCADLEVWLISHDVHFRKVLENCFDLTMQIYLESFFGNSLVHGIQSPQRVSDELRRDFQRLLKFFNGSSFIDYHGQTGFYTQQHIFKQLSVLSSIAAIVLPTNAPDEVHDEITTVLQCFSNAPGNGTAAILHLVGLRKRTTPSAESVEWVKAIAKAKREMAEAEGASVLSPASSESESEEVCTNEIHIPEMANSKYIHNIRPFRQPALNRAMSERTRPHAESTMQLLEQPLLPFMEKAVQYTYAQMGYTATTAATTAATATTTATAATAGTMATTTGGKTSNPTATMATNMMATATTTMNATTDVAKKHTSATR